MSLEELKGLLELWEYNFDRVGLDAEERAFSGTLLSNYINDIL